MIGLPQRSVDAWQTTARWVGWMEPLTPIFLASHGALLLQDSESTPIQWVLVTITALLGIAGLAGWRSTTAMSARAWLLALLTWTLLYVTGGVTAFFTLWYFMMAAVYPLVLGGSASAVYPVVMGVSYLALAPISDSQLLPAVLFGRAAVIMAIGLVVAAISNAQRRAAADLIGAKDQFVASVSHELRTPLTTVVGYAAELQRLSSTLERTEIEEFASTVYRHSIEVANLVEDLLVAARLEVDQVTVNPVPVDVRREIETVAAEAVSLFSLPDGRLTISGATVFASVDPTRFRQILRNLIANAVRHGGAQIDARTAATETHAVIEIADNGEGIPDGDADHLFAPYQNLSSRVGQPSSIGLGLAISRNLARLMGGELSYVPSNGWTVFRLELPISAETRVTPTA